MDILYKNKLFSSTVQAVCGFIFLYVTIIYYDKRIEHLHKQKFIFIFHSFHKDCCFFYNTSCFVDSIEKMKYFLLYTGSSSINLVYNFIYGIIFLLYGCLCVVGLSCISMVLGSWTKVGTRSDRKQIAFIPFGCVGHSSTTNDICVSIGKSWR